MSRNLRTIVLGLLDYKAGLLIKMKSSVRMNITEPMKQNPTQFFRLVAIDMFLFCQNVVKLSCLVYCSVYTFINTVGYPASVNGKSMQPTLNPGAARMGYLQKDWEWVNCSRGRISTMSRGDLLVYTSPKDPEEYLIKRLIATEGDIIRTEGRYNQPVVRIPPGHLWVEGDNWDNSVDSNKYGTVPKGLVGGVATHIIWPPSRVQALSQRVPETLRPGRVTRADQKVEWSNRSWLQFWKILFYFIKN